MDGDGTMRRAVEAATTTRAAFERVREVVLADPGVVFSDARTADQRCPRDFRTELTIDLGSGASVHQEVRLELDDPQLHDAGVVLPVRWRATGRDRVLPAFDGALEVTAVRPGTSLRLKGTYTIPMGVVGRFGDAVGGGRVARSSLSALVERLAQRLETEVERRRDSAGWHRESNAVTMREQEHPEIYIG
jgi:hypothetical protein